MRALLAPLSELGEYEEIQERLANCSVLSMTCGRRNFMRITGFMTETSCCILPRI